jgi:DNA-binding transcriptional regulator YiaG
MRPIEHIRREVFKMTQAAFAEVAGVRQPTVSRWEGGEFEPNRNELERIRDAAIQRGIEWKDDWFFEVPAQESERAQ